jgi:hypothetical protein
MSAHRNQNDVAQFEQLSQRRLQMTETTMVPTVETVTRYNCRLNSQDKIREKG